MILSDLLIQWRKSRGLGVRRMAQHLSISPATLSRIENGNMCDMDTFCKILIWMIRKEDEP